MLNWNAPWPKAPAARENDGAATPQWGMEGALEAQTRLWNQMLDTQRSFWAFYTPWFQPAQWMFNSASAPAEETEGLEPAQTVDGLPDALESQARNWNHFLDANRNFWAAFNWPVPLTPWLTPTTDDTEPAEAANDDAPSRAKAPARRAANAAPKRRAAAKR